MIKGYGKGANITVLDTYYQYPKRNEDGKYTDDIMTIVYKDLDTGEKKIEEILNPEYRFFKAKDDVYIDHNLLFIDQNDVTEVSVPYKDLLKYIAEDTGNTEFFYDNIKRKDRRANEDLHMIPTIFNSDMHIEDAYRFYFDLEYKNDSFTPTKSYLDIEVDTKYMVGDFPELGECPINAISFIDDNSKTISVFLLRSENGENPLIEEFEDEVKKGKVFTELKEFIYNHINKMDDKNCENYNIYDFEFQFYFYDFDKEIEMIIDLFRLINMLEPDFVLSWNMSFDIPYIIERIKILGYDPAKIMCHPSVKHKVAKYYIDAKNSQLPAQRGDFFTIIGKSVYLDQLVHFASRRKGQSAFDNLKLDNIGTIIAKVGKLSWSHIAKNFTEFPRVAYKTFVFYNIMDTLVQHCIEIKVNDIGYIFNKCLLNNTRYHKGHRQTIYLANRGIKDFRKAGFIMGNNVNKKNPKPPKFPGALVGDPLNNSDEAKLQIGGEVINVCNNLDDFDYKSLYPSIMREFGIAPNTQIGKIEIENQVYDKENPFEYDKYCRGAQFLQDLYSDNYIEFAERWFHLAGFKEMIEDMDEYFKTHTPIGERYRGEHNSFIKWNDNSIQNENNNFIIWNDEKNYNTESINNNEFIIWDNEKRNHNDILNTLRNTVQMDIDDIDMIMRRKERMIEEDKALEELLYSDDDRYYNNTNKEEEEE